MIDFSNNNEPNVIPEETSDTIIHYYKVGQEYSKLFNFSFSTSFSGKRMQIMTPPTYNILNTKVEKTNPTNLIITAEPLQIIKTKEYIEKLTHSKLTRIFKQGKSKESLEETVKLIQE